MRFNEYLKSCRQHQQLTQEQLVHALYLFDTDTFSGLDTTTVSKWERGVTKPPPSRQVIILKYFQTLTGVALPCWDGLEMDDVEQRICRTGMKNLLGKSKELVLNFPEKIIEADELQVHQLRNSEMIDKVIEINIDLDRDFNHKFTELLPEHFREWAMHPSNSFFFATYKEQFFGLLFTLRLKPEIFAKIMDMQMMEKEIRTEDLASFEEPGCNYIISFFAMNEKAATLLFIRYYAHLIANQRNIEEVGLLTMMDDARRLLKNMHFRKHTEKALENGLTLTSYRETLPNFLASEYTVKMILSKQGCPEE